MFFTDADKGSIETLREAYRQHAVSLHPDQHEPTWEAEYTKKFQAMEAEYEEILAGISGKEYKQAKTSEDVENAIKEMVNSVLEIPGIAVELCGTWLWITAPKTANKALKKLHFRWSKTKKRWYWAQNLGKGRRKARYTMPEIYARFGKVALTEEDTANA